MAKVLNSKDIKTKKLIDLIMDEFRKSFDSYVGQPSNSRKVIEPFVIPIIPKKN